MNQELEINQSDDLLNDFLTQQGGDGDQPEKTDIITERGEGENKDSESIKITPNKDNLDVISELPEDFEDGSDDDQEDVTEEGEDIVKGTESEGEYSFKALAGYLSEEGIIDFEDAEGLEDTPDVLFDSVKNTIAKEIQNYKDSIPDKAKQIIEYLEKGGDIDSYLNSVAKPLDLKNIDFTNESEQEKVVREYLKYQDYSQEDIDETITNYKDSLILDKQSKVAANQLKKHFDKRDSQIIAEQEAIEENRKEQYQEYISKVNTTIDTSEAIAGLPITAKEKLEFKKYLLAVDKEGFTPYAREVAEDPIKTQLELAYLKFMKYDFSKAIKVGENLAVKKYKNIFKNNETKLKSGRSIEEMTEKGLGLSGFEAFKNNRK